ncbi:MAG: cation:proton antiporter [Acidimicrobiia bacterium]
MSETLFDAEALILIGAGAFTLPLVAGRLRIPAVVLEIVFGVIIGPEALSWIGSGPAEQPAIALLAFLGLLLLMFLAGFEVDFEKLERHGLAQVITGLAVFGVVVGAGWVATGFLDVSGTNQRIFLTLLVSAASVGIVLPALRGSGRSNTALGQIIIITAVIAEFLATVSIVVLLIIVEDGFGFGVLAVPGLFAVFWVMLVTIRRAAWWYPEKFERFFSYDDPDEMGIRASLALLLVFVGISLSLGIEPILGAFLAGVMFAFVFRETGPLEERLAAFAYGFFVPVFFINVGLTFPLSELGTGDVFRQALALIAVAVAIKVVPSLLLVLRRFRLREALGAGVLLAGQLSVIIALAETGLDLGLLTPGLEAGAVLLVAVTAILSPILFRVLVPARSPVGNGEPR